LVFRHCPNDVHACNSSNTNSDEVMSCIPAAKREPIIVKYQRLFYSSRK
jgi:hypothetical protein